MSKEHTNTIRARATIIPNLPGGGNGVGEVMGYPFLRAPVAIRPRNVHFPMHLTTLG